jgi:ATP-dependent DNA ligase
MIEAAEDLMARVEELGPEDVVAKPLGSTYIPGRRRSAWVKHLSEASDKCFYLSRRVI